MKPVDRAILGDRDDIFKPILELRPDVIVLGYDQHFDESWLQEELGKRGVNCRVVRIKKKVECELCSSAKIIDRILGLKLNQELREPREQLSG